METWVACRRVARSLILGEEVAARESNRVNLDVRPDPCDFHHPMTSLAVSSVNR